MISLKQLDWCDFFENHLTAEDKHNLKIARITSAHKNLFIILTEDKEYSAKISGKFFHNATTQSDFPVVGDWVLIRKDTDGVCMIEKILPRKTALIRKAPADRKRFKTNTKEQAIVSNVDLVFIVTSLNQNFNLSRIERALAFVYSSGATPVILLSKSDLCDDVEEKINLVEGIAFGVPVHSFSNETRDGVDVIADFIKEGETTCLIGSSGVGKTSLVNFLCSRNEKTSEIREKDARGRHATTARSLYFLPNGGMIIDTPGLRELGLFDEDSSGLDRTYRNIEQLTASCKFKNCTHETEPGCAVREAVEKGVLDERRLANYFKMKKEQAFETDKAAAVREKKAETKRISKLIRQMYK